MHERKTAAFEQLKRALSKRAIRILEASKTRDEASIEVIKHPSIQAAKCRRAVSTKHRRIEASVVASVEATHHPSTEVTKGRSKTAFDFSKRASTRLSTQVSTPVSNASGEATKHQIVQVRVNYSSTPCEQHRSEHPSSLKQAK
jgi:hypothetical protein